MAIDSTSILSLLMQMSGGGSPQIRPTSGLDEPSLSGLQLGEQGMGLGGGGSLLGGGGGGLGGGNEGGLGLDFFQLMSQLQGAEGAPAPGQNLLQGIGPSTLGFGAGGQLQPQQGGVPRGTLGQAGMGGGQSAAQALAAFKELLGLGKALTPSQQGAATASPTVPGDVLPDALRSLGISGAPFIPDVAGTALAGGSLAPAGFDLAQTTPFQIDPSIVSGASGGGFASLGAVQSPGAISAPFLAGGGPESVGQLASQGFALPGLSDLLTGAGIAGSLGTGALALSQGNLGGGLGTFGGLGLGALLGGPFGAALGGGLGSLFGGLFGGGHTKGSHIDLPGVAPGGFDTRTAGGTQTVYKSYGEGLGALSPFEQALQAAQDPQSLLAALNQQYSPIPGQFRVDAPRGTEASGFMNLGGTPFAPGSSPFTLAALQDPNVLAGLTVQGGMLGAPANQPQVADFLRQQIARIMGMA